MASIVERLEAPIPKPVLWIGTPIAAVFLITIFVFLGFPYDQFAVPLSQQISQATGADVSIGQIEPRLTIGGPGVAARDVRIVTPDQQRIDVDPLEIRPAWSTSWLRGAPALKVDLESGIGQADGILTLADTPAWAGELREVDLARLPLENMAGLALAGTLTAAADVELADTGPVGPLSFDATAGSVRHESLPVPLEFERVNGDLMLGGDALVDVRSLELDGPMVFAEVSGTVLRAPRPGTERLDLDIALEIKSPPLQMILRQAGVRLNGQGRSSFNLGGTISNPRVN